MRFNVHMLFWSCTLAGCVLFWVAVVGCISTTMRDVPNVMAQLERDAIKPEEMTPLLGVRMLPEVQFTTGQFATVHVHYMPELADLEGGLPVMQRPIMRPICSTMTGARPSVGSSSRISRAPVRRMRPMASICCSPPDSLVPWLAVRSLRLGKMS